MSAVSSTNDAAMDARETIRILTLLFTAIAISHQPVTGDENEVTGSTPCPPDFIHFPARDRCYLIVFGRGNELNYDEARDFCEGKDAALASFETSDEIKFIGPHIVLLGTYHLTSGKQQNGTYYWNTGSAISEDNPKWSTWVRADRKCVAITSSDFDDVTLMYTMRCRIQRPFICERGLADVQDCSSMPCLNGATCQNTEQGHLCLCGDGYTGETCETDVDECLSWPCQNGASCVNGRGRYSCACGEGFEGSQCQFGDCSDHECQHGATCESVPQGYTCLCASDYAGTLCELNKSAPCPEGFVYYEADQRCFYMEEQDLLTPEDAQVACDSRHARLAHLDTPEKLQFVGSLFQQTGRYHIVGAHRENDENIYWIRGSLLPNNSTDWSHNHPKSYDDCVVAIRSGDTTQLYTMSPWYTAAYVCERATRLTPGEESCASQPCFHGGTCLEQNGRAYTCQCPVGFSDFNECRGDPCKNKAICTQHRGYYQCHCQRGYSGDNCTINLLKRCPEGFIQRPGTNRCYYTESTWAHRLSWVNATEYCQTMGASLADLTTEAEREYVASILTMQGPPHFVSARRTSDGSLYWGNGEPLTMSRVDSYWYNFTPAKDCIGLVVYGVSSTIVKLIPLLCERVAPFVCERGTL